MDEALLRSDLFGGLDPTAAEALAAALDRVDLPRGAVVFGEGEQGDRLFVLQSGVVKVGRRATDGREILLSVIGPSDVFGELAVFDPGPRTSTATCVTDVHVYSLGGAALATWIARSAEFVDHRLRLLVRRLRRAESRLTEMAVSEVASRVAAVLLHLAHRFGYQEAGMLRIRAVLGHDEIAELAGASHEVGRKALEDFVVRGWLLVDKRSLVVLEPDRLRRHARRAVTSRSARRWVRTTVTGPAPVRAMPGERKVEPIAASTWVSIPCLPTMTRSISHRSAAGEELLERAHRARAESVRLGLEAVGSRQRSREIRTESIRVRDGTCRRRT